MGLLFVVHELLFPALMIDFNQLQRRIDGFIHEVGDQSMDLTVTEALLLYEEVLRTQNVKLGEDHPDTLATMSNLGDAYLDANRLTDAIPLLEKALTIGRRKLGEDHPNILSLKNNLANAYHLGGRLADALPLSPISKVMESSVHPVGGSESWENGPNVRPHASHSHSAKLAVVVFFVMPCPLFCANSTYYADYHPGRPRLFSRKPNYCLRLTVSPWMTTA